MLCKIPIDELIIRLCERDKDRSYIGNGIGRYTNGGVVYSWIFERKKEIAKVGNLMKINNFGKLS